MKFLQIITSLRTGGAEKLILDLYPRFKASGHEMDIMVFDKTDSPLKQQAAEAGIRIFESLEGYRQMWNPSHVFRIKKLIATGDYNIVHTHNTPAQLLTAMAAGKGNRGKVKFVTTEHNTDNRRRNWSWFKKADIWMYNRYDHIVCVSESTRVNLENRIGRDPKRISVVANGIDLSKFAATDRFDESNTLNSQGKGEKIVLMVAAFRAQKDHDTMIRAMQHLPPEYKLWLAGDGALLGDMKNLAASLKLDHRIHFLGARNDIPLLMKNADIGVLASHYEGFGISAVECMAAGLPLVASDVDGLRDVAAGAGVLVPESDPESLAREILKIGENPAYASLLAQAGRERVSLYNIDNTAKQYLDIYLDLLKR